MAIHALTIGADPLTVRPVRSKVDVVLSNIVFSLNKVFIIIIINSIVQR